MTISSLTPLANVYTLTGRRACMLTISLSHLFRQLASDVSLDKTTVFYCLGRLSKEGLKFWTVTLPKLAKVILLGIELGSFTAARDALKFTDIAWQGRSLRYFRSLLGQVFSLTTGELLCDPSASALLALRQVLEYSYKLALDFEEKELAVSEEKYQATQKVVAALEFDSAWVNSLRKNAETYYPELFKGSPDRVLSYGPRFGPGSFAGSESTGMPFYVWKAQRDDLIGTCDRQMLPYSGYFKPYPSAPTKIKAVDESRVAEVLFVPKDSRGPRVISKEPLHVIKPQMAFFAWCSEVLSTSTLGRIQFRDQSQNQRLACESSRNGSYATMDLKDASDRVSYKLARQVFRHSPAVRWFLINCRSNTYKLPSGRLGTMSAIAGMGSGLTFPLLAFFVHLSVCTRVAKDHRLPYKEVSRRVYVYGDDLIVPTEWYESADRGLTLSGLAVNTAKSFRRGPFRESCGGDYLHGIKVNPVRLRLMNAGLPKASTLGLFLTEEKAERSNFILGLAEHCIELRKSGLFLAAEYIESKLKAVIPMPFVGEGSPALGVYTEDTNLILKQGSSDPAGMVRVKAVMPVAKEVVSHQCEFKYLAVALKPRQVSKYMWLDTTGLVRTFGRIPVPRRICLKKQEVSIWSLVGTPVADSY